MDLTQLTPVELDKLTKDQLIAAILEDQRIDASLPIERDEYGNAIRHVQRTKDAYDKVVSSQTVKWTYYDAGEGTVDEITVEDDKERLIVKHTLDGKQPTLTKVIIIEPILVEK